MMGPRFLLYAGGTAFLVTVGGVAATYLYSLEKDGDGTRIERSAPNPVAALGLPAGLVIGGYVWWRRRSRAHDGKTKP